MVMLRRTWKNQLENLRPGSKVFSAGRPQKPFLGEVFGEGAVAHEAEDEIDGGRRVRVTSSRLRGFRPGKCIARQFGIARGVPHGHRLYGDGGGAVSGRRRSVAGGSTTPTIKASASR